jgi:hypothetical protein
MRKMPDMPDQKLPQLKSQCPNCGPGRYAKAGVSRHSRFHLVSNNIIVKILDLNRGVEAGISFSELVAPIKARLFEESGVCSCVHPSGQVNVRAAMEKNDRLFFGFLSALAIGIFVAWLLRGRARGLRNPYDNACSALCGDLRNEKEISSQDIRNLVHLFPVLLNFFRAVLRFCAERPKDYCDSRPAFCEDAGIYLQNVD